MRLGLMQHWKEESDVKRLWSMKKFFFVTFVLSLVSIIVLRKGKGDMRGREWI